MDGWTKWKKRGPGKCTFHRDIKFTSIERSNKLPPSPLAQDVSAASAD